MNLCWACWDWISSVRSTNHGKQNFTYQIFIFEPHTPYKKGDEFFYVLVNTYEITELVDATTDTMALGNKDAIKEDIFKVWNENNDIGEVIENQKESEGIIQLCTNYITVLWEQGPIKLPPPLCRLQSWLRWAGQVRNREMRIPKHKPKLINNKEIAELN